MRQPSTAWAERITPIVTVARLTLFASSDAAARQAEAARFDPWSGLEDDHRPLGEIMCARKAAHHASPQGRAAA